MADLKEDIYTYEPKWQTFSCAWSAKSPFRAAVASFLEQYTNQIDIVQVNDAKGAFDVKASFDHPHPPTKVGVYYLHLTM